MPISISNPIVVPEKSFDKYWATKIVISAPSPSSDARADVFLLPFNAELELMESGIRLLKIEGILAKCALNPSGNFAKAMFFLLAAIDEEKVAQDALLLEGQE